MNEIIGPLYYVFCSDPDPELQGVFNKLIFNIFLYFIELTVISKLRQEKIRED